MQKNEIDKWNQQQNLAIHFRQVDQSFVAFFVIISVESHALMQHSKCYLSHIFIHPPFRRYKSSDTKQISILTTKINTYTQNIYNMSSYSVEYNI